MNFVTTISTLMVAYFFAADAASVGSRTKRETCAVMMLMTDNCSGHGSCSEDAIGPHCVCIPGWGGNHCQNPTGSQTPGRESEPFIDGTGEQPTGPPRPEPADPTDKAQPDDDSDDDNERPDDSSSDDMTEDNASDMGEEETENSTEGEEEEVSTVTESEGDVDTGTEPGDDNEAPVETPADRVTRMCNELYERTGTCNNRKGYCSMDNIGAFCQCNIGYIGLACQYEVTSVMDTLRAVVQMMEDPHYRVIGGFRASFP